MRVTKKRKEKPKKNHFQNTQVDPQMTATRMRTAARCVTRHHERDEHGGVGCAVRTPDESTGS